MWMRWTDPPHTHKQVVEGEILQSRTSTMPHTYKEIINLSFLIVPRRAEENRTGKKATNKKKSTKK